MIFDALWNKIFPMHQRKSVPKWGTTVNNYIFLTRNFNSCTSRLVNKGFLFATSSRKIKSHIVGSEIKLLVWPCLSHTEKQSTINHMITSNDSMNKLYQCRIRGFCQGISMCFSICLGKKMAIKFLGILKKYVSKNKAYFCLNKKSNVSLNKNVVCLLHDFQTWFYNTDHLLYYP